MKEGQPLACPVNRDHRALPGCLPGHACSLGRSGAGEGVPGGGCWPQTPAGTQRAQGCSFDCSCTGRMCWGALHPPATRLCPDCCLQTAPGSQPAAGD